MTKDEVKEIVKEMFKDGDIVIDIRYAKEWVHLDVSIDGENVISVEG